MKTIKTAIAAAALVALSGVAVMAEDVTTTTTTHETTTAPGPGVTVGVPGVVGVHVGAPPVETGCTTKRKTTTDTDTGDSASVTKSDC
jgi:hypothetical protein